MEYSTILRMDAIGRIIIPHKLRTLMELKKDSTLELSSNGHDILLRKCILQPSHNKQLDEHLEILRTVLPCGILLCDETSIIASKNMHVNKGASVTPEAAELLLQEKERILISGDAIFPILNMHYPLIAFFPIINIHKPDKKTGLFICKKGNQTITDMDLGLAKMTAVTIAHYINE